jgi:hypothetical protein
MESLNSAESRKMSAGESLARLERACNMADQRLRIRKDIAGKSSVALATIVGIPLASYMIYNFFAPGGVMQNAKASSGAYAYFPQNFMHKQRTPRAVYRPELDYKETHSSLFKYTERIEKQRAEGTLTPGVYHPTAWH